MQLTQKSLFPEFEDEVITTEAPKFCIKRTSDCSFNLEFTPSDFKDPAEEALEKLGYFIVAKF